MIRSHFVHTALGTAAFALAARSGASSRAVIDLEPAHPGKTISPYLHGHIDGQLALPELSGSASIRERRLTLTSVHTRRDTQSERTIRLRGASGKAMKAATLTHAGPRMHATFDAPHTLEPRSQALAVSPSEFTVPIAPVSVTKLEIELV